MPVVAVNSINWARILGQIVYYFAAASASRAPMRPGLRGATGNFGNVYAAVAARRLGLPIRQLVVGSNRNDIVTRFFATGRMQCETVVPTLSPSMDIQISSNFERYLFDLYQGDATQVVAQLGASGKTDNSQSTIICGRKPAPCSTPIPSTTSRRWRPCGKFMRRPGS